MNKRITSFYTIVLDSKVIAFGNLKDIHYIFKNIYPEARNYQFYYRKFQKEPYFVWEGYHFQQLV
jgi:hypothetical protein